MARVEFDFSNWDRLPYNDRMTRFLSAREKAIEAGKSHVPKPPQTPWEEYAAEVDAKQPPKTAGFTEKIDPIKNPVGAAEFETYRKEEEIARDAEAKSINEMVMGGYPFTTYDIEMTLNELVNPLSTSRQTP